MKTINMRARHVSITAVISSGALSVKTKKYLTKYSPGDRELKKKKKKTSSSLGLKDLGET